MRWPCSCGSASTPHSTPSESRDAHAGSAGRLLQLGTRAIPGHRTPNCNGLRARNLFWIPIVKTAGNRRAEKGVPFLNLPNCGTHAVKAGLLDHIAHRTRVDGLFHIRIIAVRGKHEYFGGGNGFEKSASGLQSIEHRHGQVHEHQCGPQFIDHGNRLLTVARFADHLNIVFQVQNPSEFAAQEQVVVRQQNGDPLIGFRYATTMMFNRDFSLCFSCLLPSIGEIPRPIRPHSCNSRPFTGKNSPAPFEFCIPSFGFRVSSFEPPPFSPKCQLPDPRSHSQSPIPCRNMRPHSAIRISKSAFASNSRFWILDFLLLRSLRSLRLTHPTPHSEFRVSGLEFRVLLHGRDGALRRLRNHSHFQFIPHSLQILDSRF
jgi:hypothetical protein